jgi:hypothetical protein
MASRLTALALNCTLSPSPAESSTQLMIDQVLEVAVVGNEDGAHKITCDLFQALNDCGFTVPAQGAVYWNGEAMSGVDYKDLDKTPEAVTGTTATPAANAAHLTRQLAAEPYPAVDA